MVSQTPLEVGEYRVGGAADALAPQMVSLLRGDSFGPIYAKGVGANDFPIRVSAFRSLDDPEYLQISVVALDDAKEQTVLKRIGFHAGYLEASAETTADDLFQALMRQGKVEHSAVLLEGKGEYFGGIAGRAWINDVFHLNEARLFDHGAAVETRTKNTFYPVVNVDLEKDSSVRIDSIKSVLSDIKQMESWSSS